MIRRRTVPTFAKDPGLWLRPLVVDSDVDVYGRIVLASKKSVALTGRPILWPSGCEVGGISLVSDSCTASFVSLRPS